MVKNGDRSFLFNERGELIIAKLSGEGYKEIDRTKVIDPTAHREAATWFSAPGVREQMHVCTE